MVVSAETPEICDAAPGGAQNGEAASAIDAARQARQAKRLTALELVRDANVATVLYGSAHWGTATAVSGAAADRRKGCPGLPQPPAPIISLP
jgi:hypothetical protein